MTLEQMPCHAVPHWAVSALLPQQVELGNNCNCSAAAQTAAAALLLHAMAGSQCLLQVWHLTSDAAFVSATCDHVVGA
jgi:hypothetical protein